MLIVRLLIAIIFLFSVGFAFAESNPPAPTPPKSAGEPQDNIAKNEKNTEPDKRGTKEFLAIIEISKSPVIQVETTDKTEKRRNYSSSEWWAVYLTGALAAITLSLAIYTAKLWRATKTLVKRTEKSTKTIERAYVKMSHHSPPGLRHENRMENDIDVVLCKAAIETKNYGSTPARVTKIHIEMIVAAKEETPPKIPNYRGKNSIKFGGAFLVKDDSFNSPVESAIPANRFVGIQTGKDVLIVIGYVDYIDIFHIRHRAGYGRRFSPEAEAFGMRNNLVYMDSDGYNYDRPRKKGEGDDWEEHFA